MNKTPKGIFIFFSLIVSLVIGIQSTRLLSVDTKTYTIDTDFDLGILNNVEHQTVHDQLQLVKIALSNSYIWVPNENGTISKVDTNTLKEVARFWTAPTWQYPGDPTIYNGKPSRTAIDSSGNCWVGNRQAGTVVKIGNKESGFWIDRNNDGICQTSAD